MRAASVAAATAAATAAARVDEQYDDDDRSDRQADPDGPVAAGSGLRCVGAHEVPPREVLDITTRGTACGAQRFTVAGVRAGRRLAVHVGVHVLTAAGDGPLVERAAFQR